MSARWMTMVLALRMSSPLSTMLVDSSTSYLPSTNSFMVFSSAVGAQPAMRHGHADLRHQLAQLAATCRQVLDARADIEALAAAELLAQDRLADDHAVERHDEGAHRQAIDRRRGDQAHLAHAGQRQLQRARDRRRGQRQHMDVGAQLLQPLLVADAEMLLLVDDQQAEVLELDALGQQRVGADDDVDRALLDRLPWSPWPPWRRPGATAGRCAPAGPGSAR